LRAENNLLSVSIANQRPSPSATLHICLLVTMFNSSL